MTKLLPFAQWRGWSLSRWTSGGNTLLGADWCVVRLYAPAKGSWQPPDPSASLCSSYYCRALPPVKQVSNSAPAKPWGKRAWPKCQLINEGGYLRNKQGLQSQPCTAHPLQSTEKGSGCFRTGESWLFATLPRQQQSELLALTLRGDSMAPWAQGDSSL